MTIHIPHLLKAVVLAGATLAIAGCGTSDEEEIRGVVTEFMRLGPKDAARECELLTPRAVAQLTAFVGGEDCEKALRKVEQSDERPTPAEVDKATLKIRADRAVLSLDGMPMGLRKVDGDWRVDNMFNGTLDEEPRQFPAALSRGSDEQQVRATVKALGAAYRKRDFQRACDLFSYGAEAQLFIGLAFASFADTEANDKPPADPSCEWVHRKLERLVGDKGAFADELPSAARIDAARVSIRGDRATLHLPGDDAAALIRQDGHWLVGADAVGMSFEQEKPSPASLERCWKRSGAQIATSARDLRFAVRGTAKAIAIKSGLVSVKGDGWRVFYSLPSDGEDPGLGTVLAKPSTVGAVAYISDAAAHPRVVARARACGS